MKHPCSIFALAVVMALTCAVQATAQKKDAAKKETIKKEIASPPQTQTGIKEVLSQYVGKVTNLGTLKRVAGDYFVLEEDGNTVMHPLSTLHTIKLSKNEESGEIAIEIKLFAKD